MTSRNTRPPTPIRSCGSCGSAPTRPELEGGVLGGRGGGARAQKFVYPKRPDQIFPTASFAFSRDGHFDRGGEGGGGRLREKMF